MTREIVSPAKVDPALSRSIGESCCGLDVSCSSAHSFQSLDLCRAHSCVLTGYGLLLRLTLCDCAAYWVSFGHRFAEFPPNSGRTLAPRDSLLIIMTMTASSRRLTFGTKVGLCFPHHVLPSKYPSGVPLRVRDLLAPLKSSPTDKDSSTSSSPTSSEPPTSTFEMTLLVESLLLLL